jgi:ubiquinone/menaquinone biosynthesis C-methylase UbiE
MTKDLWHGGLYAANTGHHRRYDDAFLQTVPLGAGDSVLDLGCGVGDFTERLAAIAAHGRVVGLDASRSQLDIAAARGLDRVEWIEGRAQDLDRLLGARKFDAIVSRATLHWIAAADHPAILRAVLRHLGEGGVFRAEFGGRGQIAAVCSILDEESAAVGGPTTPWFFPDVATYRPWLEDAGFDLGAGFVRLVDQRRAMPTPESLIGYLRSQVFVGYDGDMPEATRAHFRARSEARALGELERPDGSYDLDFVRMDVRAHAPASNRASMPA